MNISDEGIALIKKYEGCKLTAYKPVATEKYWTIGYGRCNASITEGMKITQSQADQMLKEDLVKYEKYVDKYAGHLNLNINQFSALCSFTYNCGAGNLQKLVKNKNLSQIANDILLYTKAGGKTLSGLVKRRKDEQTLFLSSTAKGGENMAELHPILKLGSNCFDVRVLQSKLSSIGYSVSVNGNFDATTKSVVIQFQRDSGLSTDGIVGAKTWKALDDIKVYSKIADGNKSLSPNFKIKEFACQDGSDTIVLHTDFVVDKLQKIRSHFGKPITINSAYRNPTHNKKVGGSSSSYHVKGRAFDIVVKDVSPNEVARYAQSIGIKGIIRYSWGVHVDSRAIKYFAVDSNGKKTPVGGF